MPRGGRPKKKEPEKKLSPPIMGAFCLDQCAPGSNIYEAPDSTYILQHQPTAKGDRYEWHSIPPGQRRFVLPFVVPQEKDLEPTIIKTLFGLARQLGRAVELHPNEAARLTGKFPTVLKPPMDPWMKGSFKTIECPSLPPGVYILLPKPEDCGLLIMTGPPTSFGLFVITPPRVVAVIPGMFGPDGIVEIPDMPDTRSSLTVWERLGVEGLHDGSDDA